MKTFLIKASSMFPNTIDPASSQVIEANNPKEAAQKFGYMRRIESIEVIDLGDSEKDGSMLSDIQILLAIAGESCLETDRKIVGILALKYVTEIRVAQTDELTK